LVKTISHQARLEKLAALKAPFAEIPWLVILAYDSIAARN